MRRIKTETNITAAIKLLYISIIILFLIAILSGCTVTEICVHQEGNSTATIDTSTTANPVVDPSMSGPLKP